MKATALGTRLMAILLAGGLLAPTQIAAQAGRRDVRQKVWKDKDSGAELRIQDGSLVGTRQGKALRSIPLSAIVTLGHEGHSEHPASGQMQQWVGDVWEAGSGAGEGAIAVPFVAAAGVAILLPFLPLKSSRHYVLIEWKDDLGRQKTFYQLSKKDTESLLAELEKAAGLQRSTVKAHWDPNPEESRKIAEAREQLLAGSLPAIASEPSHQTYRLVFLEGGKGAIVIFVPKDAMPKHVQPGLPLRVTAPGGSLVLGQLPLPPRISQLEPLSPREPGDTRARQ